MGRSNHCRDFSRLIAHPPECVPIPWLEVETFRIALSRTTFDYEYYLLLSFLRSGEFNHNSYLRSKRFCCDPGHSLTVRKCLNFHACCGPSHSKTEKFQTWAIPSGGGVVRNMSVTRDANIATA